MQIVEALSVGVLVTAASGRLLYANRKGRSILAERDGLMLDDTIVRSALRRDAATLRHAVADASSGLSRGALLIGRSAPRAALRVLVSALSISPGLPHVPRGAVLLLVLDAGDGSPPPEDALRSRYGLTLAEARVAAHVAQGLRPAAIARELGVRVSTVRTHLRQVLAKTATHCQADLVRCLLTGTDGFDDSA